MATTVRDLLIRLGVDADTKTLAQFDSGLRTVTKGLTIAATAGIAFLGTLGLITASTAAAGDAAAKAAKRLGLTAAEFQELSFAAQRSGADIQVMEVALRTVARQARDAMRGTGQGKLAFDQLGISVADANGDLKRTPDLLSEAATALKGLTNESEQIALAQDIFGRGGSQLLPLLLEGADGIEELRKQARELGFVLDEQTSRDAEAFQDALLDAGLAAEGLKTTIGAELLPVGIDLLNFLVDAVKATRPFVKWIFDTIDGTIGLRTALGLLVGAVATVSAAAATAAGVLGIGALVAAVGSVVSGVGAAITLLTSFATLAGVTLLPFLATLAALFVFAAAQVIAFWGAVVAAGLVIEDFVTFLTGGLSVLGLFVDKFVESKGPLGDVARLVLEIRDTIASLLEFAGALASLFVTVVTPAIEGLIDALRPLLGLLAQVAGAFAKMELRKLGALARGATALLGGAESALGAGAVGVRSLEAAQGGGTSSSTTNNISANVNAPITTTGGAGETAQVVKQQVNDMVRRAFSDVAAVEG